jgi:hypothetical protein
MPAPRSGKWISLNPSAASGIVFRPNLLQSSQPGIA